MEARVEDYPLHSKFMLYESSELSLTVDVVDLALVQQSDKVDECRFTLRVSSELYDRVDAKALFNLKSEIRGPLSGRAFQSSSDIQIEASLDPALLSDLTERFADAEQVAIYLQQLNREQPKHPIFSAYSWYALEVKQQQENGEVGYRTLWKYLPLSAIAPDGIDQEKMDEAMNEFAKEWSGANGSGNAGTDAFQAVEDMNQTFENLTEQISEKTQEIFSEVQGVFSDTQGGIAEVIEDLQQSFEGLAESFSEIIEEIEDEDLDTDISIYDVLIEFFKAENRPFETQPNLTLSCTFRGEGGYWDLYARAKEAERQCVFYSVLPVRVPKSKHLTIAEFIARANYNMTIGNFEIDFDSGEIRYKTSMDVEGIVLTPALVKRLADANTKTMDWYLPGIMAAIERGMGAKEAIALVERQTATPMEERSLQLQGFQASLARELVGEDSTLASENEREGQPIEESRDRQEASTRDRDGKTNEAAVIAEASEERVASEADAEEERRTQVESAVSHFMASQQERIVAIGQTARPRLQAAATSAREALTAAMERNRNAIPQSMAGAWDRVRSDAAATKKRMTAQHESTMAEIQAASAGARDRAAGEARERLLQKIHDSERETIERAGRTLDEGLQNIDVSLRSTMDALDSLQTARLKVLETVGQQQEAGMDAKVEPAAAALQERVAIATAPIDDGYRVFADRVRDIATIGLEEVCGSIAEAADRMAATEAEIKSDLEAAIVDYEQSFLRDGQQAIVGLNDIAQQASEQGDGIAGESEASISQIAQGTTATFQQMREAYIAALEVLVR